MSLYFHFSCFFARFWRYHVNEWSTPNFAYMEQSWWDGALLSETIFHFCFNLTHQKKLSQTVFLPWKNVGKLSSWKLMVQQKFIMKPSLILTDVLNLVEIFASRVDLTPLQNFRLQIRLYFFRCKILSKFKNTFVIFSLMRRYSLIARVGEWTF